MVELGADPGLPTAASGRATLCSTFTTTQFSSRALTFPFSNPLPRCCSYTPGPGAQDTAPTLEYVLGLES